MQETKRLEDLLEDDAQRIESERRPDRSSDIQRQIKATAAEIRNAFGGTSNKRVPVKAKLTELPRAG